MSAGRVRGGTWSDAKTKNLTSTFQDAARKWWFWKKWRNFSHFPMLILQRTCCPGCLCCWTWGCLRRSVLFSCRSLCTISTTPAERWMDPIRCWTHLSDIKSLLPENDQSTLHLEPFCLSFFLIIPASVELSKRRMLYIFSECERNWSTGKC